MSRKSGNRFSDKDMRKISMSRKSGNRFSDKDMRKIKSPRRITIQSNRDALWMA